MSDRNGPPAAGDSKVDLGLLPSYARGLLAYHRAHTATLNEMMDALPVQRDSSVLDLATGDGTFAMLFAERGARVTALDRDEHYLAFAERRARERTLAIRFLRGDALALPFEDHELDAVFCAQSFYDLPDISGVLAEMRRVVRPGGWVAVLENDSFHHLVLPWPPELEVALRAAQLEALSRTTGGESRFFVGRRLGALFEGSHFSDVHEKCFATQMTVPLSKEGRAYLEQKLGALMQLVGPYLHAEERRRVEAMCSPSSPEFMLSQPTFSATVLDFLVWAEKR